MLKSITFAEVMIVLIFVVLVVAIALAPRNANRPHERCLRNGYMMVDHSKYCMKVQGGNTIIIHVDSLK